MSKYIVYRKPQTEIDNDVQNGLIMSEYAVVHPSGEVSIAELLVSVIPVGASNIRVIEAKDFPQDRMFRDAWDDSNPESHIGVHVGKAKEITHGRRRMKRAIELAPFDEVIMKQIPGHDAQAAEVERQKIRDKHAALQVEIDSCSDEAGLRAITEREGLHL